MKHTPGPWVIEDHRKPGQELPWRSTGQIWAQDLGQKTVCIVDSRNLDSESKSQVEEFEANARLIAKSPEMKLWIETALGILSHIESKTSGVSFETLADLEFIGHKILNEIEGKS